jgi:hypothetical protein
MSLDFALMLVFAVFSVVSAGVLIYAWLEER